MHRSDPHFWPSLAVTHASPNALPVDRNARLLGHLQRGTTQRSERRKEARQSSSFSLQQSRATCAARRHGPVRRGSVRLERCWTSLTFAKLISDEALRRCRSYGRRDMACACARFAHLAHDALLERLAKVEEA
eukprot:6214508-Pleurochrysis_carterae.AAC.3